MQSPTTAAVATNPPPPSNFRDRNHSGESRPSNRVFVSELRRDLHTKPQSVPRSTQLPLLLDKVNTQASVPRSTQLPLLPDKVSTRTNVPKSTQSPPSVDGVNTRTSVPKGTPLPLLVDKVNTQTPTPTKPIVGPPKRRRGTTKPGRRNTETHPTEPESERRPMGDGTVSVLFGRGYAIMEITPVLTTTSTVLLGNLPARVTLQEVRSIIKTTMGFWVYDRFVKLRNAEDGSKATISFREAFDAQTAAAKLNGYLYESDALTCSIADSESDDSDTVKIHCNWYLPSKSATVTFSYPHDATVACRTALRIRNSQPKYQMRSYEEVTPYSIFHHEGYNTMIDITELDATTTENDLKRAFPHCRYIRLHPATYEEPQYQVTAMIMSLFEKHSNVSVKFAVTSKEEDRHQQAIVTFDDSRIGETLFNELKDQRMEFLGGATLDMSIVFTAKIRIPVDIYRVISRSIQRIIHSVGGVKCKTQENDRLPVWLTITGSHRDAVAAVNTAILKRSRGSVVCNDEGHTLWDPRLTSPAGRAYLSKAATSVGVHIRCDARMRTIRVFGSTRRCVAAREPLLAAYQSFLDSLLLPVEFKFPRNVLWRARAERVAELRELQGSDKVDFIDGNTTVTVRCTDENISAISRIIRGQRPSTMEAGDCAVCYCEAEDPIQTTCNHIYCKSCLKNSILAVVESRRFPVRCIGAGNGPDSLTCDRPVDFTLIQRMINSDGLDGLYEAALAGHIQSHPNEFYYCPTPDCTSIFAVTTNAASPDTDSKTRTCSQCLVTSCRSCRTVSHPMQSCEDNMMSEDEKNAVWKKQHGIKVCPKCGIDVEKNEGCNHMTCRCGCHFCWICGKEQPAATIYVHMGTCRGPAVVEDARGNAVAHGGQAAGWRAAAQAWELEAEQEMERIRAERERRRAERERMLRMEGERLRRAEQEMRVLDEQERQRQAEQERQRQAEQERLRRAEERNAGWECTVM